MRFPAKANFTSLFTNWVIFTNQITVNSHLGKLYLGPVQSTYIWSWITTEGSVNPSQGFSLHCWRNTLRVLESPVPMGHPQRGEFLPRWTQEVGTVGLSQHLQAYELGVRLPWESTLPLMGEGGRSQKEWKAQLQEEKLCPRGLPDGNQVWDSWIS